MTESRPFAAGGVDAVLRTEAVRLARACDPRLVPVEMHARSELAAATSIDELDVWSFVFVASDGSSAVITWERAHGFRPVERFDFSWSSVREAAPLPDAPLQEAIEALRPLHGTTPFESVALLRNGPQFEYVFLLADGEVATIGSSEVCCAVTG